MAFFVRHIEALSDLRVGAGALTERLRKMEPRIATTISWRISTARRIVESGMVGAAMEKIAGAKFDDGTAASARRWRA